MYRDPKVKKDHFSPSTSALFIFPSRVFPFFLFQRLFLSFPSFYVEGDGLDTSFFLLLFFSPWSYL